MSTSDYYGRGEEFSPRKLLLANLERQIYTAYNEFYITRRIWPNILLLHPEAYQQLLRELDPRQYMLTDVVSGKIPPYCNMVVYESAQVETGFRLAHG